MDTLTKRKRGAPYGNKNAVGNRGPLKDGHFSRWAKEARWARWQSLQAEAALGNDLGERAKAASWAITQDPPSDRTTEIQDRPPID